LMLKRSELKEQKIAAWLITALVMANNGGGINISDLPMLPEKLGIQLPNPREVVRGSENLVINRNLQGLEVIGVVVKINK
jgi:hypothetical protein